MFVDQKYHTCDSFGAKTQQGDYKDQNPNLRSLSGKNKQLGLKLVLVVHLTNFWCLLTKSTTLEIVLALKHKKEITKIKIQTCVSFGLKTCFGGAFDKLLLFVDQKYHT